MASDPAPPSGGAAMSRRETKAVWILAIGQMLGYACFFYLFAALVLNWQRTLGWGEGVIAAGPLLAILCTAALSPKVGRWVDRGLGLRLMAGGTVLGALALALLAASFHPVVFLLAFVGLGAAAAMTLYEVCFALMIRRFGAAAARGPITRVTLVAGLASTLAFPAGAALTDAFGWRGAVWIACAVVILVMLPLQAWGAWVLGGGRPRGTIPAVGQARWGTLLAKPGALRVMALFALVSLDHWMLVNLLRPLLDQMGLREGMAIAAGAVIGPAQVLGRLALLGLGDRVGSIAVARITAVAMIVAAGALVLSGLGVAAAFVFALMQGAAMGVLTILRPVLIAEVNGPSDYAAAAAVISLPSVLATALSPMIGTGLLALGGPDLLIGVALVLSLAVLVLTLRMGGARR